MALYFYSTISMMRKLCECKLFRGICLSDRFLGKGYYLHWLHIPPIETLNSTVRFTTSDCECLPLEVEGTLTSFSAPVNKIMDKNIVPRKQFEKPCKNEFELNLIIY